jgi:hypothetical protein
MLEYTGTEQGDLISLLLLSQNRESRPKSIWTFLRIYSNEGRYLAMAGTCLPLLPTNGRLLCLLGVTVSVLSSIRCFAHSYLGFTLSVLSSVRPDVLGRCSK